MNLNASVITAAFLEGGAFDHALDQLAEAAVVLREAGGEQLDGGDAGSDCVRVKVERDTLVEE